MRKQLLPLFLLSLFLAPTVWGANPAKKLEVIYFHATRRCATCKAIEENTRKTLNTYFAGQLKSGVIKLSVINVDEEKNSKVAEKYEATGSALFLTVTGDGKESRNDMSDLAFSYARSDPEKFIKDLRDKINQLLK